LKPKPVKGKHIVFKIDCLDIQGKAICNLFFHTAKASCAIGKRRSATECTMKWASAGCEEEGIFFLSNPILRGINQPAIRYKIEVFFDMNIRYDASAMMF